MERNTTMEIEFVQRFQMDEGFPGEAVAAANLMLRRTELNRFNCAIYCELQGEYLVAVIPGRTECSGVNLEDPANFDGALSDLFHWLFSTLHPFEHGWRYLNCEATTNPVPLDGYVELRLTYQIRREERNL